MNFSRKKSSLWGGSRLFWGALRLWGSGRSSLTGGRRRRGNGRVCTPPLSRPSPFVRIVSVARLVAACRNAFESVLEAPAGWSVEGVRCGPTTLVVRYRRESSSAGTVRDLESAIRRSVEMRDNGEAEGSWSLHVPSSSLLLSKIPTLREEKKDLATVLEREGIEEVGSNPPAIAFPLLPDDPGLLTEISSVPGFSATALIWSKGKGWTLKGEWKHAS